MGIGALRRHTYRYEPKVDSSKIPDTEFKQSLEDLIRDGTISLETDTPNQIEQKVTIDVHKKSRKHKSTEGT
jgi:hypothetical protein